MHFSVYLTHRNISQVLHLDSDNDSPKIFLRLLDLYSTESMNQQIHNEQVMMINIEFFQNDRPKMRLAQYDKLVRQKQHHSMNQ